MLHPTYLNMRRTFFNALTSTNGKTYIAIVCFSVLVATTNGKCVLPKYYAVVFRQITVNNFPEKSLSQCGNEFTRMKASSNGYVGLWTFKVCIVVTYRLTSILIEVCLLIFHVRPVICHLVFISVDWLLLLLISFW